MGERKKYNEKEKLEELRRQIKEEIILNSNNYNQKVMNTNFPIN